MQQAFQKKITKSKNKSSTGLGYSQSVIQEQNLSSIIQSSIAQQQVFNQQAFKKESIKQYNHKRQQKNYRQKDYSSINDNESANHPFLLNRNDRFRIVTAKDLKNYELKSQQKQIKYGGEIQIVCSQKKKSQKKSLSGLKTLKKKQLQLQKNMQVQKHVESQSKVHQQKKNQSQKKAYQLQKHNSQSNINRQSQHQNHSVISINDKQQQKWQKNQPKTYSLKSHIIPFYYTGLNLNTQVRDNRDNRLIKFISEDKLLVDVGMDFNEFNYHLKLKLQLQRNRGLQVYLIAKQKPDHQQKQNVITDIYKQIPYYKLEMIRLPPNLLRLRVYLLIQSLQVRQSSNQYKQLLSEWKLWKQLQVPMIQKSSQPKPTAQYINQSCPTIQISIATNSCFQTSIKINNLLQINLSLNHSISPISYYCVEKDFNGVDIREISLQGKERIYQIGFRDPCQGNCQLI